MKLSAVLSLFFCFLGAPLSAIMAQSSAFRPPAYPLVTHNPYFSIWSFTDHPGKSSTRHWTGSHQSLTALARIDGVVFRLLGQYDAKIAPMKLVKTEVHPTRTVYAFEEAGARILMTFTSPLLPWNLALLSLPATYLSWQVESLDGKEHAVQILFDVTGEPAVNRDEQEVAWARFSRQGYHLLRIGSTEQPILKKSGDDLRIDWGFLYLSVLQKANASCVAASAETVRKAFLKDGAIPTEDDLRSPRAASDDWPVLAARFQWERVTTPQSAFLVLTYDDLYTAQFLRRKLLPYWKNRENALEEALAGSVREYDKISEQCRRFDSDLEEDLLREGGPAYRDMAVLAYRQALAAHGLAADIDGAPYFFPKENFSNGCMGTVDVIYPGAPLLLLFNLELMKASLEPVFRYAESGRWKFPFAPHDLGRYPLADGQVYGGREKSEENQMPVEESANMIILTYAIAQAEKKASFAVRHWPALEKWAQYLQTAGFDPENQLCTDDFTGHLAHNTNLSAKAIVALASFSKLAEMTGRTEMAFAYARQSKDFARLWMSRADDGDHYRLAFDRPGTWSQKYNLVWDKVLQLGLFDPTIAKKEIAYYKTRQLRFGLPLDNRAGYTKLDWIFWTATLADNSKDFLFFIDPTRDFASQTPERAPLTDWYETGNAKMVEFQARSVVGGLFIKMLANPEVWQKWLAYRP